MVNEDKKNYLQVISPRSLSCLSRPKVNVKPFWILIFKLPCGSAIASERLCPMRNFPKSGLVTFDLSCCQWSPLASYFWASFVPDDKGPQLESDWSPHLLVRFILHYGNYNYFLDEKIISLACGDHHPTILASFSSYKQCKGDHHCQEPEIGISSDLLTVFSLSIVVFYPFLSSIRDGLTVKTF